MNDYPLLWVVYGFTILLPVVGAIACCFWPKVRGRSAVTTHNIDMNICFCNLLITLCRFVTKTEPIVAVNYEFDHDI